MSENLNIHGNPRISAVICELNPLHFGHAHLFETAKKDSEGLICVLSGNFVQRGEPAILDKWARTSAALQNGADMVIELPIPWACAGAERFAAGGVYLANALGSCTRLVFGCEEPNTEKLMSIAEALLSEDFTLALKALKNTEGETFAVLRERAVNALLGNEYSKLLSKPNCVLAVEYCKALIRQESRIKPAAVQRVGARHDKAAENGEFWSAGQLRERILSGESAEGLLPDTVWRIICKLSEEGRFPAKISYLERAVLSKLRTMSAEELAALPDISEGLENRIYTAARTSSSLGEMTDAVKSKRYTQARIRRLIISAFLGIDGSMPEFPPYIRILGMNRRGKEILKNSRPSLPLVLRAQDSDKLEEGAKKVIMAEAAADDLYELALPVPGPCGRTFTQKLIDG